ncbi:transcriptional regulator MtlR [Pseudomonas aeruginosa]|nr:transcriptional regulator MtlR [Pseudomonas aeruginosa]
MPRASKVTDPSYELMDDHEGHSLIYRQHGFPSPLVRWHFHKEYELHLIVASSGKVFIGDYIGNFAPDTLFLTGPNLPHNWISQVEPDEVVARRDMLVNFTDEVLEDGSGVFSELNRLAPLLARARYGIEFRDPALIGESRRLLQRIADSGGMTRLGYFFILMEQLAECEDYQLLSTVTSSQLADEHNVERINRAVDYIFQHYAQDLTQEQVAAHLGMTPTYFSRFFKQAAGRGFGRVRQPPAHQQVLRAAGPQRAAGDRGVLRVGLQQPVQFQPALPAAQGHDAHRLPAPGDPAADRAEPALSLQRPTPAVQKSIGRSAVEALSVA